MHVSCFSHVLIYPLSVCYIHLVISHQQFSLRWSVSVFSSLYQSICLCTKTYPSTHLSIITIFVSIYLLIYFLVTFVLILLTGYGDNLMPGEFRFPFSFKLPDKLPPTYEGLYGHIRYLVEARNDVQWGATEHAIARFNVAAVQDLNADPKLAVSGCRVI